MKGQAKSLEEGECGGRHDQRGLHRHSGCDLGGPGRLVWCGGLRGPAGRLSSLGLTQLRQLRYCRGTHRRDRGGGGVQRLALCALWLPSVDSALLLHEVS